MAVGQVLSYSIPPLDSSSTSLVIVRPSWASAYKFNLYFSTRRSSRGDSGISSTFINTISVHSIDKTIDPKASNENGNINILRTVSANTRQVFSAQQVVLQVGAVAPDQSIGITLCRYSSSDSKCSNNPMKDNAVVVFASAAKYSRTATTVVNEFSMNSFWMLGVTLAVAESYAASGAGVAGLSYIDTQMIVVNDFLGNAPAFVALVVTSPNKCKQHLVIAVNDFLGNDVATAEPLLALNVVSAYQVELQDQGCVMGGKSVSTNQPGQVCRVFRGLAPWGLDSNDTVANWLAVAKSGSFVFISNIVVQCRWVTLFLSLANWLAVAKYGSSVFISNIVVQDRAEPH
eukprot:gene31284-6430_t